MILAEALVEIPQTNILPAAPVSSISQRERLISSMDDDLESELMDLATNESVYLPQATHSRPPVQPTTSSSTASIPSGPASPRLTQTLPAALANSIGQPPLTSSSISALPAAPSASPLPLPPPVLTPSGTKDSAPLDSGEEPAGWYDQLEMLLATAEARYYAWVDELETQGSANEEEFRRAEAERMTRRSLVVQQLKLTRRAAVHAQLAESSTASLPNHESAVDVDAMMDKLARVVDESARQLTHVRRDGLWTKLAENLPQVERDYVAKGSDEMFLEKLKYKRDQDETRQIVEQHLKTLFQLQTTTRNGQSVVRTMNHSLGQALREFADIFHYCYGDPVVKAALSTRGHTTVVTRILALVAADVNAFASVLVQVLHYKYPDLPRSWSTSVVHRCVIDALFEHLQPTLHMLYVTAFELENGHLSRLCQQMRSSRLDRFGVTAVFRLDGSWSASGGVMRDANDLHLQSLRQYEPMIGRMNGLPTHRSPWVKAALVASVCRDIDHRVKEFYARQAAAGQPCPPPSAVSMTADDLSALLAFLIVSSPALCSHLATQLALLGSFMESETGMGEEGFAIATLWTAVSLVCHLT